MERAYLQWTPEMSTGKAAVDEQHRKLIEVINRLLARSTGPDGRNEAFSALKDLDEYVREHFAQEERHMLAVRFPGYAAHKAEHDEMRATVATLRASIRSAENVFGATVAILPRWLERHLMGADREFAAFLSSDA
ncbi:bacteriohemerythrin [Azospirillum soli]|uniref:bacteriohemerythrin n=1 Tax=Azospirillum soli TaxID=1304799 RepID=UPI001AE34909|nr:hemerythrin-like metal-binding protein [Azospirillum soli]